MEILVPLPGGSIALPGMFESANDASGLVIFAHGSGSSRFSPRNRAVAAEIRRAGFATLLFDLLTEDEASDRASVFNIPLLGTRVASAVDWARGDTRCRDLPIGLFGASTGAAAALVAATARPDAVSAVVSRGGRPDLAGSHLGEVQCPTMLIVGGADDAVLQLNEDAFAFLRCPKVLRVIPGATHLFEEPGALAQVVDLAVAWFRETLVRQGTPSTR